MISLLSKGCADNPIVFIILLLVFFGAIVGGVILVKKYVKPFQNEDKPKSAEENAEEEVARILEDVEDEETAKAISSYKIDNGEDKDEGEDKPILK